MSDDSLAKIVGLQYWIATDMVGSRRSGEIRVEIIKQAREQNDTKARILAWGMLAQLVALVLFGAALLVLLWTR